MTTPFELTNNQRQYFGLVPICDNWDRIALNDLVTVYFDLDTIVKILDYSYGYNEYEANIETNSRTVIKPRTLKGSEQKLTASKLLKIKGSGVSFSIAFGGGGLTVYDNRRDVFFIKSYFEDGDISNFIEANIWIENFIKSSLSDHFNWLSEKLKQPRRRQEAKPGDIIAFKVGRYEYGFARIIKGILKKKDFDLSNPINNYLIYPYSLTIATFAFTSCTLLVDIDKLVLKETLPSIYIFDTNVHNSEMPIIGHKPLTEKEEDLPLPIGSSSYLTIYYTKTDILGFIKDNDFTNNLE